MEFGLKKIFCICICHLRGITWHTLLGGELEEVTQLGTPSPHILDNQTKVYGDDNEDDDDGGSGLDHSIFLQCLKMRTSIPHILKNPPKSTIKDH